MRLAQKTLYALKALVELAKQHRSGPCSIAAICSAQSIPPQFLQVIMRELRQGSFVESRRGKEGGYLLSRKPSSISLGEVIRFLEGSVAPVELGSDSDLRTHGPFLGVWREVQESVDRIYDSISFQDLVDRERHLGGAVDYVI